MRYLSVKFSCWVSGELLNFGLLFVQFFATDVFLNGKWRYYGLKVIEYYSFTFEQRNDPDLMLKYGYY